ncbi:hypothetical protein F1880_005494 [Penicillium rolfsii]|nr:hypothetical protein F1880_005494 [Penicillium rolfsii]
MEPRRLPRAAEDILDEIKKMISPSKLLEEVEDENGNKRYKGQLLDEKISQLKVEMQETEIDQSWTGRLIYFSKQTTLVNDEKPAYFIPLSDSVNLTPGGRLSGGSYIRIANQPSLSSGAFAIFIVPSDKR